MTIENQEEYLQSHVRLAMLCSTIFHTVRTSSHLGHDELLRLTAPLRSQRDATIEDIAEYESRFRIDLLKGTPMTEYVVPRSGTSHLIFVGERIAVADGRDLWPEGKSRPPNRFHSIALYRTQSGRYVVTVSFRCNPEFDDPYDEAEVFDDPQDVVEYLNDFDALEGVRGWPSEKHQGQDRRLRTALTNNFETLVSQVLAGREEFAERV